MLPVALRLGAVAGAAWAVRRVARVRLHPGRTDQRAEDALDDLDEGLAIHSPADRATPDSRQTNTAARMVRTLRFAGRTITLDAALMARLRIHRT